jgi:hypothetical protein
LNEQAILSYKQGLRLDEDDRRVERQNIQPLARLGL